MICDLRFNDHSAGLQPSFEIFNSALSVVGRRNLEVFVNQSRESGLEGSLTRPAFINKANEAGRF
jgi:hypothetical protein